MDSMDQAQSRICRTCCSDSVTLSPFSFPLLSVAVIICAGPDARNEANVGSCTSSRLLDQDLFCFPLFLLPSCPTGTPLPDRPPNPFPYTGYRRLIHYRGTFTTSIAPPTCSCTNSGFTLRCFPIVSFEIFMVCFGWCPLLSLDFMRPWRRAQSATCVTSLNLLYSSKRYRNLCQLTRFTQIVSVRMGHGIGFDRDGQGKINSAS